MLKLLLSLRPKKRTRFNGLGVCSSNSMSPLSCRPLAPKRVAMGAGTRLRRYAVALVALVAGAVSSRWHFVVPQRPRQNSVARAAEGYFPGVEVEATEAPNRGSLLERLQEAIPEDEAVGEHTEEVKLLREQTAILAQELRLLRELLQDGSLAEAVSQLQLLPEVVGVPAPPEEEINRLPSSTTVPVEPPGDPKESPELGMASLLASEGSSFRHRDAVEALGHLSKRVVERRVEGELPLGQVPSVG
eukprot:s3956_g2.t1